MKSSDDRDEDKWSFSINLKTSAECFSRWLKVIPHVRRSSCRTLEREVSWYKKMRDRDWTNLSDTPVRYSQPVGQQKLKASHWSAPCLVRKLQGTAALGHILGKVNLLYAAKVFSNKFKYLRGVFVFVLWVKAPTGSDKTEAFLSLPLAAKQLSRLQNNTILWQLLLSFSLSYYITFNPPTDMNSTVRRDCISADI